MKDDKKDGKKTDRKGQDLAKVLPFRRAKAQEDTEALKLVRISDEIDAVILKHLEAGEVDARDLVGLLSHRLGTLMRHIDGKTELWPLCAKVVKKQARLD